MRIFLAYPFSSKIPEDGLLPLDFREEICNLKCQLEKNGHTVISAHEREDWGESILPPNECTKLDHKEISEADILVAYPGNPPSGGVHIELGWASALGKTIIVISKCNDVYSPLVVGLSEITTVINVTYDDIFEFPNKLNEILNE